MAYGYLGQGEEAFEAEGALVFTPIDEQSGMPIFDEEMGGEPGGGPSGGYEPQYQQAPPAYAYGPQYAPQAGYPPQMPMPYGYPQQMPMPYGYQDPYAMMQQQMPYGYPQQMPYGYQDPYAMQQPYGQQPYGQTGCQPDPYTGMMPQIDPYTGQPCGQQGYQDPYAQQQAYQQCAARFPAGTPQSVIDATCAIAAGGVQPWQVTDAVNDLTTQGQTAAAAALLAKLKGQPNFNMGEPTADQLASGCKRVAIGGGQTGTLCPRYGTIPTDAAKCKALLTGMAASASYKAARTAKTKTPEQMSLIIRYNKLAKCAGVTAQASTSARALAKNVYSMIFLNLAKKCKAIGGGKQCNDPLKTAVKNWSKITAKVGALTDKALTPIVAQAVIDAAKAFLASIPASGDLKNATTVAAYNEFYKKATAAGIALSA